MSKLSKKQAWTNCYKVFYHCIIPAVGISHFISDATAIGFILGWLTCLLSLAISALIIDRSERKE